MATYYVDTASSGGDGTTQATSGAQAAFKTVAADPSFTNAAGGDFTLQAGFPCIDAGADLGTTYQMALRPGTTWPGQ